MTEFGSLLRDLRKERGLSQSKMAARLGESAGRDDGTPSVDQYKRWEREKNIPGDFWLGHLVKVLDTPFEVLHEAATLARMNRRAFLSLTALTAAHGKVAGELAASIAGGDCGPLMVVQTTHGTDRVIAALTDAPSAKRLDRWMRDGGSSTLRVNAAGILAKRPGQESAVQVSRVLVHDDEVRQLYSTAVLARVGALPWAQASRLALDPTTAGRRAQFLAQRLAVECLNEADAGARWVSAAMLRDLTPLLSREAEQ